MVLTPPFTASFSITFALTVMAMLALAITDSRYAAGDGVRSSNAEMTGMMEKLLIVSHIDQSTKSPEAAA